ncbi:preprotein translocase subunit SecY [Streptomyces sp. NPDC093795]|uniref:preprotein translocase subunit SecY n=1 Tax=Streptomyces sp. NPDC093795 TaxID=3366051 RepID=UPI0037F1B91D
MWARVLRVSALRKQLLWTVLAVVVFRLGQNLPLPGVRGGAPAEAVAGDGGGPPLHGLVELLTGGGLGQLSVFAFGIAPVIAARLVVDVVGPLVPRMRSLKAAGEEGAAVIARGTRWVAVILAAVFAGVVAVAVTDGGCVPLTGVCAPGDSSPLHARADGLLVQIALVACMTAGTAVVVLLAGLITARGVGEGFSILFLAQIAAVVPDQVLSAARETGGTRGAVVLLLVAVALVVMVVVVVTVQQGERRIPVQQARRMIGRRLHGPTPTYVPVRGGQGGFGVMIPASLLLLVPAPVGPWLLPVYVLVVFAHAWLRAGIEPDAAGLADRLKGAGLFVPGIRPGRPTAEYIAYVQSRIGLAAALCMTAVALIPVVTLLVLDGPAERFALSTTTLLITVSAAVGTALPVTKRMETVAALHRYAPTLR